VTVHPPLLVFIAVSTRPPTSALAPYTTLFRSSPSSWLRQCPDRCTIRAGRNLPDKEFRYLRTVIVTAAVYRGFNSMLLPKNNISSEEHTSELQSRFDLVCRLLLEKKK